MKSLIILGILMSIAFISGIISTAEAHPHVVIDLMDSHSHNIHDNNFQENFTVHSFEHVITSTFELIKESLFR